MNDQVEKTISNSLNGFQWILGAVVLILIIYLILKSNKKSR
ncbi:hypothetical protein [Moheibacter sediminis]|uniref:Uncharacterized protein n=1 Tax=Moheibacter sediminis TaxID=1434700 RepID=A0A1W1YPB0_9FLAO|nr:hypothetical protein [Moheibacter sediminis]SMC37651.1 hypothetical protein SAMN06296427_101575 [Moheibacter sediminis]